MKLTAKLKLMNYVFKEQCKVTEIVFTLLPEITTKRKMDNYRKQWFAKPWTSGNKEQ